jgi:hypothetical protein
LVDEKSAGSLDRGIDAFELAVEAFAWSPIDPIAGQQFTLGLHGAKKLTHGLLEELFAGCRGIDAFELAVEAFAWSPIDPIAGQQFTVGLHGAKKLTHGLLEELFAGCHHRASVKHSHARRKGENQGRVFRG